MIQFQKPKAFYDVFTRKGPGQKVITYCPGCGHGTIHKLIGIAIDELGIQDRTIFCSPVGCSVFAYYYFDTGNIQCSHGRAPAVATGIRRTLNDAIIVSYQGDGDLAAIGTTEIIHSANRGENLTVFFVNNAIYGMTGGQMAPTTLIGQRTKTTPMERSLENEGPPIRMAEVINALSGPAYIERVSLGSPDRVLKAKRAIKKALRFQVEKKGFSFVEILSPCPINWKMDPVESRRWLVDTLEKYYPIQVFREGPSPEMGATTTVKTKKDLTDAQLIEVLSGTGEDEHLQSKKEIKDQHIKIAGFGGQGVLSAGVLLANCAMAQGLNSTWLPSYGPEMRGGTANASVVISNQVIGTPVVDTPNVLIAMNGPSLDTFEKTMVPGGLILVNSSIVSRKTVRSDVRTVYIPASDIAREEGLLPAANIVMVGVYCQVTGVIDLETIRKILPESIKSKKHIDANVKILHRAVEFYQSIKGTM